MFRAGLMLTPAVFTAGAEAAEMFYAPGRFTRKRALLFTTVKLLQDYDSVQTLDGAAHRHRKAMFMDLMGDKAIPRLVDLAAEEWRKAAAGWPQGNRVELLGAAQLVISRAVLRWVGLSPDQADAAARARAYGARSRAPAMPVFSPGCAASSCGRATSAGHGR